MADNFEPLPADYEAFFKTGVLPDSLKTVTTPPASTAAASAPASAPAAATSGNAGTPAASTTGTPPSSPAQAAGASPIDLSVYERVIAEGDRQRGVLETQLKALQEQVTKLTATPAPDPTTDPLGFINHQMKTLQDQIAALTKTQTEAQTAQQNGALQQQFINSVNQSITQFKQTTPDYDAAYKHMIDMRTQDYLDSGMTKQEALAAVAADEVAIATRATQQGKNPAEIVYGMAKRYGYTPAAPKTEPTNKLEQIQKGMEAAKTVDTGRSSAGDVGAPGEVTVESLENMGDDALTEMVMNNWEKITGRSKGIF